MCSDVLVAALALEPMSAHAVIRHFDDLPQSSGALMAVRTSYYACRHQRSEHGAEEVCWCSIRRRASAAYCLACAFTLALGMWLTPAISFLSRKFDKTHGISVNRVCIRVLAAGRRGVLSVVFLIIIVFFKTNDQAVVSSSALKFRLRNPWGGSLIPVDGNCLGGINVVFRWSRWPSRENIFQIWKGAWNASQERRRRHREAPLLVLGS